jgi:hypothetical protein
MPRRALRRHGRSRLAPKARPEQTIRDERERPGELVHVEIKKLGRIALPGDRVTGDRSKRGPRSKTGRTYLFVAIDDATRLGFTRLYPDETADSATHFHDELVRF